MLLLFLSLCIIDSRTTQSENDQMGLKVIRKPKTPSKESTERKSGLSKETREHLKRLNPGLRKEPWKK